MSRDGTEQLLRELARDVSPVRPIPRLRAATAGVLALWAIVVLLLWMQGSPPAGAARTIPWQAPGYGAVLVGLALIAGGATLAALAGAVPGREWASGASGCVALLGLLLAVGGGLIAVAEAGSRGAAEWSSSAACIRHAAALAFLPALAALLFLARGYAGRPVLSAALGVTGTVALGAVVVHVSCRAGGGLHMLLGHALAPLLLGFLVAAPIGLVIRRWRRGR